ncbi:MAG TPA: iron-containing redox enzyme family protein [Stellaceae bacterium]|nr:iron-containing redox enzyme family protein [Stellaceae bacterium]
MKELKRIVASAQQAMAARLDRLSRESLREDQYVRYLSMQYHLTKGVQRHFIIAASHPDFAARKELREYLFKIGVEEELHYQLAERDVAALGSEIIDAPLDVRLWHAYFSAVVHERPLVRIGAHCVLENIVSGRESQVQRIIGSAPYARRENTRFVMLHLHVDAPHGTDILDVLGDANLESRHMDDLIQGARDGGEMYLRLIDWSIYGDDRATTAADRSRLETVVNR